MNRMVFNSSPRHTIGVEIELGLVDQKTMALCSAMPAVEKRLSENQRLTIKPELMQAYAEVVSGVCNTVADAEVDLKQKIIALEQAAGEENVLLYWSGTHPFSTWQDQNVTDEERYHGLVNLLQDTARQLITYGLHVHVGVDSGDKAIMICDRILSHLPTLLALSANSPWWEDRVTGLHSWRSKVMDGLPTAGLPPLMRNWSEYVWLLNHLMDTGFIESIREIWWDVRPHHNFGTVEVRICDVPGNLDDVLAITALVQCLVKALSDQIDEGTYQHDCHPMMVRQNKWRAARYGLDAQFVESQHYQTQPGREVVTQLANMLTPISKELQCDEYLVRIFDMAKKPTWADRQLAIFKETGDKAEVVRQLTAQSRLSKSQAAC
jgi:glutamate---cysteine ligase / carboxylate-amine ligase